MAPYTRSAIQDSVTLTNLSQKIANDFSQFGAARVAPLLTVPRGIGKIRVFDRSNLRAEKGPAGRRGAAVEVESSSDRMAYATKGRRFKTLVLDQDVKEADGDVDGLEMDATELVTEKYLLDREKDFIAKAFTAGNYATGHSTSLTNGWASSSSTPIADVRTAVETVRVALAGRKPNKMACGVDVWNALRDHGEIVDRVKYVAPGVAIVRENTVAQIFDLDEIIVIGAVENTAKETAADGYTLASMISDKAIIYYDAPPTVRGASFMRMLAPAYSPPMRIRKWREEDPEGMWIACDGDETFEFLAVDDVSTKRSIAGYLIENAA